MGFENQSPKWTFVFIGISVIAFIIQQTTTLWRALAFFPSLAFRAPWMFVTSIFLHANLSHLFFNMFALFFVGIYLERMVGRRTFFTIFLTSGIIGNLGYLVTASNPQVPAIGASGAVYGVMGALAVIAPFLLVYVYGFLPLPMILVAVLYGLADFAGLCVPSGIANGAHLGGMFVGASYGVYLRRIARRITV